MTNFTLQHYFCDPLSQLHGEISLPVVPDKQVPPCHPGYTAAINEARSNFYDKRSSYALF